MTKFIRRIAVAVSALLVFIGLAAVPHQVEAANTGPQTVDIVLHKLLFKEMPAAEQNDGQTKPSFGGQASQPLNGVTFTAYDITSEFWAYVHESSASVEKAQSHFAEATGQPTNVVTSQVTAGEGIAEFAGLKLREASHYAVYLFKETGTPAGVQGQSQNLVVVLPVRSHGAVQSRIDLYPKNVATNTTTTIEKTVDTSQTLFAAGEKIPYQIKVKVPADIAAMADFSITDSADSALKRQSGVTVKIGGSNVTDNQDVYRLTADTDHNFTATFVISALAKYAGQTITISYNMAIRPGTAPDQPLINDATVHPGRGHPQHDYAVVTTGGKRFVKVNAEKESEKLAGAVFIVRNGDGAYLVKTTDGWHWKQIAGDAVTTYQAANLYTLTSDQAGAFAIEGLAAGSYDLFEVKAPAGYLRNEERIPFQIVAGEYTRGKADPYKVVNVPRPHLPDTWFPPGEPGQPNVPKLLRHLLPQTGEEWAAWVSMLGLILIALITAIRVRSKKVTGDSKGEKK